MGDINFINMVLIRLQFTANQQVNQLAILTVNLIDKVNLIDMVVLSNNFLNWLKVDSFASIYINYNKIKIDKKNKYYCRMISISFISSVIQIE